MRLLVLVAAAAALSIAPAPAAAKSPPAASGAPQRWIGVTLTEISSHSTNPPRAARVLAHVSAAMARASAKRVSVDAAASTVLSHFYPDRAAAFASQVSGKRGELASGRAVGRKFAARARADGSAGAWTGSVPTGEGLWVPTPPAFAASPLEPLAGAWRTWNLTSGSQFRPGPPPRAGSAEYAAEVQAVYDAARALTPAQKSIALFWADGAGTVTPPGHWNQIALELMATRRLSDARAAQILATLNTAQADAFIACWDAKFAYWSERPVTAIRRLIDPSFAPVIGTPPFPSYISGHSTTSGAASTVLASFFPRHRAKLAAMAGEAAVSRLYGGIHFPVDNDTGLAVGKKVGAQALRRAR